MKQILTLSEPLGQVNTPSALFRKIKKIDIDYTQENLLVFFLDSKNEVISSEVVFKGGLISCTIDPKTIFRKALLKNSTSIIMAHNHPSGYLEPSREDNESFDHMVSIGNMLQLTVLDSLIFNKKEFYALRGK